MDQCLGNICVVAFFCIDCRHRATPPRGGGTLDDLGGQLSYRSLLVLGEGRRFGALISSFDESAMSIYVAQAAIQMFPIVSTT